MITPKPTELEGEEVSLDEATELFDAIESKPKGWIKEICEFVKKNQTARKVPMNKHQIEKESGHNIARKARDYGCLARYDSKTKTVIIAYKPT